MKANLHIVADHNMPNLERLFGPLGRVTALPGRTITRADLSDCDILLVRSVTRVDAALLAGSRVRFVGSATIGTDHIDLDYLAAEQISFAHAPGCNAASVAQYDLAVLAALRPKWRSATLGILGGGNVGGRVARLLGALGADVVLCDPFLATGQSCPLVGLNELLQRDIVLLHAPLTDTGPHPTAHLIGAAQLAALRPGTLLVNAGRGGVIDSAALLAALEAGTDLEVALDVWEDEPLIDDALLARVALASPHIAGYSVEGRSNGSAMIAAALRRWLGVEQGGSDAVDDQRPVAPLGEVDNLNGAVLASYQPRDDDARLRVALASCNDDRQRAEAFDRLRREYPPRREFRHYQLAATGSQLRSELALLGFALAPLA